MKAAMLCIAIPNTYSLNKLEIHVGNVRSRH